MMDNVVTSQQNLHSMVYAINIIISNYKTYTGIVRSAIGLMWALILCFDFFGILALLAPGSLHWSSIESAIERESSS
jgi:hypothetical protein